MEKFLLCCVLAIALWVSFIHAKVESDNNRKMEDVVIEAHVYREPGCPMVVERIGFQTEKVEGSWSLSYGSLNWLADLASASFDIPRHPKVSEIRRMCTSATIKSHTPSDSSNTTMEILFKTRDQTSDPMVLRCWPQRFNTKSKFECFFSKANIHTFLMVAATDHESWILLIRCKIGINQPGEGMSWAVLSKAKMLDPDTAIVIFGVLEGYGFDLRSYKFENSYEMC